MRRLREILRNEYIGAIAIGFLLFQAASDVIQAIMQPIGVYIQTRSVPRSVMTAPSIFHWPQIIALLTDMVVHVIVAWLLILWLYRKPKEEPPAAAAKPAAAASKS